MAEFIAGQVMQIIGTTGAARRPEIARGAGAWCHDPGTVHLVISAWQWPKTVANLRENDRIAVTFTNPIDYVSYQIKGTAGLREASAADLEQASRYIVAMTSTLMRLGMTPEMIHPWLSAKDAMVISVRPSSVFVQTPGANAGARIWSAAP